MTEKQKSLYVFKAVVEDNERWWSVCKKFNWSFCRDKMVIEYSINKKTLPIIKDSAIYTFGTVHDAIFFVKNCIAKNNQNVYHILECEYKEFKDCRPIIAWIPASIDLILKFWKDHSSVTSSPAPSGTVMCEWIRPIRDCGTVRYEPDKDRMVYHSNL